MSQGLKGIHSGTQTHSVPESLLMRHIAVYHHWLHDIKLQTKCVNYSQEQAVKRDVERSPETFSP